MRNEFLQLIFAFLALMIGGVAEETLPKFLGVGFPVLLALTHLVSSRSSAAVLFAIAAGAMEDALCSLPLMTSVSYFMVVMVLVRRSELPLSAIAATYPGYQLWLLLWTSLPGGGVFWRMLLALPIGLLTMFVTAVLFTWLERRSAINGQG